MKKICYLGSATSIHIQRWANYFVERGWDVHIITKEPTKDGLHPDITQHVSSAFFPQSVHKLNFPIHLHNMNKVINLIKPDIIHAISIESYGAYTGFIKSKGMVLTGWGFKHTITSKGLQKWIEQRALKKADVVHVDSYDLEGAIVRHGCDENKTVVIPWGVNIKMFSPDINGSGVQQELDLESSPVVISARYFETYTDIGCLINAIPDVLKALPDSRFIIAGSGSLEHELKQLTKDLEVWRAVNFVGKIPHPKLPAYFRASDIYVSTSLLDSSSVSLLDAMACGLPIVVTNTPSNDEWVENGKNGFIFPMKDSKSLAEKIIYLLKHPELMEKFGKRNREIIVEKADEENVMGKIEKIYKKLINKKR